MEFLRFLFLVPFACTFFVLVAPQLLSSQSQVLLQLQKQLEYPKVLDMWSATSKENLCYLSSSNVNITCQENFVTEVRIFGDWHKRDVTFNGFPVQYQTLSQNFSMDSLIATLSRLTSLKALTLVSLGIWGPLPVKISRLSSLQHLDLSWNFLFGSVPPTFSRMVKLQTLALNGNFFNGSLPDCFDSLSNLRSLSLSNNILSGSLPSSISRVVSLTDINLSKNEITGKLPDFSRLVSLHFLDLSNNKLGSKLPTLPRSLVLAVLENNMFSGVIPNQYSQLKQLQQLDLSLNSLQGTPPGFLFSLPSLNLLNLSSNSLGGQLPLDLKCGNDNGLVDISNNRFIGLLPSCLSKPSVQKVVKYGGNCLLIDIKHQHPEKYCINPETGKKKHEKRNIGILIGIIAGVFSILVIMAFGCLVLSRRFCHSSVSEKHLLQKTVQDNATTGYTSELLTTARFISETAKLSPQDNAPPRIFSVEELKEATNNFKKAALIGEGSNGKIYKGQLLNGTHVAIRCLTVSKKYTIRNLKLRLDLLAKLRHPHLVCLLGHCIDIEEKNGSNMSNVYLVYEHVPDGNYLSYLSDTCSAKPLRWSERLDILMGVAKAVHFLHTGTIPGFSSNRLKARNILLNQHHVAKLSDYGLSLVREQTEEKGEETIEGHNSWNAESQDDDVYSFGVILMQSLVGPFVSARKDTIMLNDMATLMNHDDQKRVLDPIVYASSCQESRSIVISLTSKCISPDPALRPPFEDILWNLQYAAQTQTAEDADHRSAVVPVQ